MYLKELNKIRKKNIMSNNYAAIILRNLILFIVKIKRDELYIIMPQTIMSLPTNQLTRILKNVSFFDKI